MKKWFPIDLIELLLIVIVSVSFIILITHTAVKQQKVLQDTVQRR